MKLDIIHLVILYSLERNIERSGGIMNFNFSSSLKKLFIHLMLDLDIITYLDHLEKVGYTISTMMF